MNRQNDHSNDSGIPEYSLPNPNGHSLAQRFSRPAVDPMKPAPRRTEHSIKFASKNDVAAEPGYISREDLQAKIAAIEAAERQRKPVCIKCGATNEPGRLSCSSCGEYDVFSAKTQLVDAELGKKIQNLPWFQAAFGGSALSLYLWKRLGAKVADSFLISSVLVIELLSYLAVAKALAPIPGMAYLCLNFFHLGMPLIAGLTVLTYRPIFESSLVQATPGKLLLGLGVHAPDGQLLSSSRAFFKSVLEYAPFAIFVAAYTVISASKPIYAAHLDAASMSVLVMLSVCAVASYVALQIPVGRENRWRTALDTICGCVVEVRERKWD